MGQAIDTALSTQSGKSGVHGIEQNSILCGAAGVAKKGDHTLYLGQRDRSTMRGYSMIELHEEYLVDEKGNRKAVVIPISEWQQVVEMLEELDDIRAYDEAKSRPSDAIPFEQAVAEIRQGTSD